MCEHQFNYIGRILLYLKDNSVVGGYHLHCEKCNGILIASQNEYNKFMKENTLEHGEYI